MTLLNSFNFARIIKGVCIGANKDYVFFIRGKQIYKYNADCSKVLAVSRLKIKFLDSNSGMLRLLFRLLRYGITSGVCGEHSIFIWSKTRYYVVDIYTLELIDYGDFENINSPINVLPLVKAEAKSDMFLFGEYSSNPSKSEVGIFVWDTSNLNSICYIPANEINHIHNIVNKNVNEYVVFCGDWDSGAAIWRLKLKEQYVEKIVSNEQEYRASVGIVAGDNLIYATDTTSICNSLISFDLANSDYQVVNNLPASSIYGASYKGKLVFSTNLEVCLETKYHWNKWVTKKLPAVFATKTVHVYSWNGRFLSQIFESKPSWLPYRLFQYPTFRVHLNDLVTILSGYSLKKYDNKSIIIETSVR